MVVRDLGFSYTVTNGYEDAWYRLLNQFRDATIFQTPAFAMSASGASSIEQFLLRRDAETVAAAVVRVTRQPFFGECIAYVFWGPLVRLPTEIGNMDTFRAALRFLREEYVEKRRLALRVSPQFTAEDEVALAVLEEEGFMVAPVARRSRTILVDLDKPLANIRSGLDQKWRNCLNRAEKNDLDIAQGSDEKLFELFAGMYWRMLARKRIPEPGNLRAFRSLQQRLPDRHKLHVIIAFENKVPSAGAIVSAMGERGIYLFGATADAGLRNKAAYLVQWKVIQWLKQRDCTEYDLHGSNKQHNPGVYAFKVGLAGKNGKEVQLAGSFDAYEGIKARIIMSFGDTFSDLSRRARSMRSKYRTRAGGSG